MADSNIGALPQAQSVADDSLLVMEQQGQAMKLTGQMLKSYAKQGVELEFQDYLDEAKKAAEKAAGAVSAVTDMTVEAHASDTATVTKTTRNGKVNLDFGLPRGEQGVQGPEGKTGPRGPQGAPGNGLTIRGHYDTETDLLASVTDPEAGDAYSVGTEPPYDIYVFDGVSMDWKNYGPLSGGGGTILPENVVTSEGGASLEIPAAFGGAPHVVTFTDEEEPPMTAEDIVYGDGTVQDAISTLFTSGSEGKSLIASAVTAKGIETAADATFAQMAENIGRIQTGSSTQDATATPGDILASKTAYTASGKVEGIIPSRPAQTITPGTADQTIANGQYLAGTQIIKGDPNLTSANIKKGVTLFGVAGALESSFSAALTVKADVGAVVTATCGDTAVEALSTNGTVVLELPVEGTWKVTAVRGMAQYNTVTLEVSSRYSAVLTAEVHVEYFGAISPMDEGRRSLAAAKVADYAVFAGGVYKTSASGQWYFIQRAKVDVYNKNLVKETSKVLPEAVGYLAGASSENFAVFAGGLSRVFNDQLGYYEDKYNPNVYAFDENMTRTTPAALSSGRMDLKAVRIGGYVLFGGGKTSSAESSVVDSYDDTMTKGTPLPLVSASSELAAASNDNYALFGGGYANNGYLKFVTAYNTSLTRSIPAQLGTARKSLSAVRAGNFVVFGGGETEAYSRTAETDAYDLFLTRTTPDPLQQARSEIGAACLNGFGIFAGGCTVPDMYHFISHASVDAYDPYLAHVTPPNLSAARAKLVGESVGGYALFAGGTVYKNNMETYEVPSNVVDVYQYV